MHVRLTLLCYQLSHFYSQLAQLLSRFYGPLYVCTIRQLRKTKYYCLLNKQGLRTEHLLQRGEQCYGFHYHQLRPIYALLIWL